MKRLFGVLLAAMSCAIPCMQGIAQAPVFENYYELGATDEGYDICAASDGGFVIVAERRIGIGVSNLVLLKIDSAGNQEWLKLYGSNTSHRGISIKNCSGGYICAGYYQIADGREFPWVLKFDYNGDTLWTANNLVPLLPSSQSDPGNGYCLSVIERSDSTFYTVSQVSDSVGSAYYLTKITPGGDTLWTRKYEWIVGGPWLNKIENTLDGNLIIYGRYINSLSPVFSADALILKVDINGDTLWTKKYPVPNAVTSPYSVVQTSDSGFFVSGVVGYVSNSEVDYFAVRTDQNGDTLWTKTYGGVGCNDGGPGIQCRDGSYLLSGLTLCEGAGMQDLYLVKLDTAGNFVWDRTYGGASDDRANSILQTSDGGFIACGISCSFGFGNCDVYVVKTDSNGIAPTGFLPLAPPQNHFVVYPNPTNGIVFIDYSIPENEDGVLEVYSITGALIFTEILPAESERMQFDWSTMEPGMYLVRMVTNDNTTDVERIIITE